MLHRLLRALSLAVFLSLSSGPSSNCLADGLIHRLPEDGSWVQYQLHGIADAKGTAINVQGTIKVSSVGKSFLNGEACRWLEFEANLKVAADNTIKARAKVLIPEKLLVAGKDPSEIVHKIWAQVESNPLVQVQSLDENEVHALRLALTGPLADQKKLDPIAVVAGKIGNLDSAGVQGTQTFSGPGESKISGKVTKRLSDKVHFGVVEYDSEWELRTKEKPDEPGPQFMIRLTFDEQGTGAQSAMPDAQ